LLLPAGFQLERARALLRDPGDLTIADIEDFIARSSAREETESKEKEEIARRQAKAEAAVEEHQMNESRVIGLLASSAQVRTRYNGAADSLAMAFSIKRPELPNSTEYIQVLYNGLNDLREIRRIETPDHVVKQIFALNFSPTGKLLAAAVPNNLLFFDADTGEHVHSERTPGGWVMALRWSPDGKRPLRQNVKALSPFWVVGQACNSFLGRQDDRKRQSSHQDETEGPTRVQIEPTSRHEFKTQIAID